MIKSKIRDIILNSKYGVIRLLGKRLYDIYRYIGDSRIIRIIRHKAFLSDKVYISMQYFSRFHEKCNLDHPVGFNEKNNWRKLYDRQELYTHMVDKYKCKSVVFERCGEGYCFPLLDVWDDPRNIDFSKLPNQFVLKPNHAGGVIVCRDKALINSDEIVRELRKMQKFNYFLPNREWPYKNVKRRIICEEYMGENLIDYKTYCFNGKLHYTFVWKNKSRKDGRKPEAVFCGAYDREWVKSDIAIDYPSSNETVERPSCFSELVKIAEAMSYGIPFVRVDCYIVNESVYVGEMTFFPWSGYMKFKDKKWDIELGNLLSLESHLC